MLYLLHQAMYSVHPISYTLIISYDLIPFQRIPSHNFSLHHTTPQLIVFHFIGCVVVLQVAKTIFWIWIYYIYIYIHESVWSRINILHPSSQAHGSPQSRWNHHHFDLLPEANPGEAKEKPFFVGRWSNPPKICTVSRSYMKLLVNC